jgi:type IV pilus assembly protein PilN
MLGIGPQWIGIAIEQTGIRYIRLNKKKDWEIDKKCYLPLEPGMIIENRIADGEALQKLVKQWVKQEKLRGGKISLSIPPSQMIIRKMTIPSTNPKQVKELVKLEVETGLQLPFDNPVYDYVTTEIDEENTYLLVIATPRKLIEDYVAVLEYAGMKVSSVEISATAIARTLAVTHAEIFEETMLIHLEQSLMDIYMFRSGHPVFMRTIDLYDLQKGNPVTLTEEDELSTGEAVGTEDFLSSEKIIEITAEISRMLNFYQYSLHDGSTRITDLIITGSPKSRLQLLDELVPIMAEQNVRAISFEHCDGIKADPDMNDYRNALGTALKSDGSFGIDLLPREDRETQAFPYVAAGLLLMWLGVFIAVIIMYLGNQGQISSQTLRIEALNNQSVMLEQELTALQVGGAGGMNTQKVIDALLEYRVDAVDVLDELEEQLPKGGVIRDITYTAHSQIVMTINFVGMEDAATYLEKLREMSFTVSSMIDKLSLESTSSGSTDKTPLPNRIYSAVYRVDMNQPQAVATEQTEKIEQEGGGIDDGTNK